MLDIHILMQSYRTKIRMQIKKVIVNIWHPEVSEMSKKRYFFIEGISNQRKQGLVWEKKIYYKKHHLDYLNL